MLFVRGKLKNVLPGPKKNIKYEIPGANDDDIVYLCDDGHSVHEKTGKRIYEGFTAETREEMENAAKQFFKKHSIIILFPTTKVQHDKSEASNTMPKLVVKYADFFTKLIGMGSKGKFNISSVFVAERLKINKAEAKLFLKTGVMQGVFKKDYSSWSITDAVWKKLETLYVMNKDYETSDSEEESVEGRTSRLSDRGYSALAVAVINGRLTIDEAERQAAKETKTEDNKINKRKRR